MTRIGQNAHEGYLTLSTITGLTSDEGRHHKLLWLKKSLKRSKLYLESDNFSLTVFHRFGYQNTFWKVRRE